MHRAYVDDTSAAFGRPQMPDEFLRGEKDAFQIDVENLVVIFFAHFPEWRMRFESGVVDQNIEPSKMLDALINQSPDVFDIAQIGFHDQSAAAGGLDFGQRFFRALRRAIVIDDDIRAFPGEANGDGASDALTASRYERNFVF